MLVLLLINIATGILALTPFWFFLFVRYLLAPEGFLQNLILLGFGYYFLGAAQIICLVLWLAFTFYLWLEKPGKSKKSIISRSQ